MTLQSSCGRSAAFLLWPPAHFGPLQKPTVRPQGTIHPHRSFTILTRWLAATAAVLLMAPAGKSQCSIVYSGLESPVSIVQSETGNLLVSESGSSKPNTGVISIVKLFGTRQTLLSGLPSGINDVGGVSGPAGLFLHGRTLYVAISAGDAAVAGPLPGSIVVNPAPSSPIFSSVLALHFSNNVENTTAGFTLTVTDQQALARGEKVTLSNGSGDQMTIELVANFPDFPAGIDPTIAHSNPFGLVAVADKLYVTDGGENLIWQVDLPTGSFMILTHFPGITNPLYPGLGGPTEDAVPTGIRYSQGRLLVALFRGVPFATGTSVVEQVDPATGSHKDFITGLTSAIDIDTSRVRASTDYLVLQYASVGPFLGGPGVLLRFPSATSLGPVDCLTTPTSMALDEKTDTLYVTELTGRIVAVKPVP